MKKVKEHFMMDFTNNWKEALIHLRLLLIILEKAYLTKL